MERKITKEQIKMLHVLYRRCGMDKEAHQCTLLEFTGQRTNSTSDLTFSEARELILKLSGTNDEKNQQKAKKIVKDIYFLSLQISFLNKDFASDDPDERKMNYAKINAFCRQRSKARKNLTVMSLRELEEVKKQLEAIARKEKGGT